MSNERLIIENAAVENEALGHTKLMVEFKGVLHGQDLEGCQSELVLI
jgi:hypothetical protein